jgi:hypothetical protein
MTDALANQENQKMTEEANACDRAIARYKAAMQAIADVDNPESPVALSQGLTGAPTLKTLLEELHAAEEEMDVACQGKGPSR